MNTDTLSKSQIQEQLDTAFSTTINWIDRYPENELNKIIMEGKWTAAGHVYHLIKSTKAMSVGIRKPKLILRWTFGLNNRNEKSYEQLKNKYNKALESPKVQAPEGYSASPERQFNKSELIARSNHELDQLKKAMIKWNEKQLTKYIVPHPALGKMTIREVLYFTIFHTKHHLNILEEKYKLKKEISCKQD